MHGAWRQARVGDTPAQVLKEFKLGQLQPFSPTRLARFPISSRGDWVVLQPQPPWVAEAQMLTMYPPAQSRVTLYDGTGAVRTLALNDFSAQLHGYGRLSWTLGTEVAASTPLLLKFEPVADVATPVAFALETPSDYRQNDAQWLMLATACLTVMLAMALMALCFALILRDITFAWYAGYLICYAFIQGIQTGFVFHPINWQWLSPLTLPVQMAAMTLSVLFAVAFMIRFCNLTRYARWPAAVIKLLAAGMVVATLLGVCQIAALERIGQHLMSPLIVAGALSMLVAGTVAGLRGSRYAWFFLGGWSPLLVITAMGAAQMSGALPTLVWAKDGGLVAGALEALVLSVGLADRALMMRREGEQVRQLADRDALTQVLNRRAWNEATIAAITASRERAIALLFLDLDHFKTLNDCQGHAAGDQALVAVADALRAELRPADLLGRYGGEEFVVMLDGTADLQALQIATRLCRCIHQLQIPVDGSVTMLTASIGVAIRSTDDTLETLVARADHAMYEAKVSGRNRVRIHQTPGSQPSPRSVATPVRDIAKL